MNVGFVGIAFRSSRRRIEEWNVKIFVRPGERKKISSGRPGGKQNNFFRPNFYEGNKCWIFLVLLYLSQWTSLQILKFSGKFLESLFTNKEHTPIAWQVHFNIRLLLLYSYYSFQNANSSPTTRFFFYKQYFYK